jgi:hypothetical protein
VSQLALQPASRHLVQRLAKHSHHHIVHLQLFALQLLSIFQFIFSSTLIFASFENIPLFSIVRARELSLHLPILKMDPLSITASIYTLIIAVKPGIKLVQDFCNAKKELESLDQELNDLTAVLDEVQAALPDNNQQNESLSRALFSLMATMEELDSVFNRRITLKKRLWKFWWAWTRNALRVKDARNRLQTAREQVMGALGMQTL